MGIKDIGPGAIGLDINYKRTKHATREAEEAWRQRGRDRSAVMKVLAEVAEGCAVETVRETMLYEREEVTPQDVGGAGNLDRLRRIGVVNTATERQAKTNRGEYGWRIAEGKSVSHQGQIWEGGVSEEEFDVPATPGYKAVDPNTGRLVEREGRPAVAGRDVLEDLVKRGLAERAAMRERVVKSVKQRLKSKDDAEGGAS